MVCFILLRVEKTEEEELLLTNVSNNFLRPSFSILVLLPFRTPALLLLLLPWWLLGRFNLSKGEYLRAISEYVVVRIALTSLSLSPPPPPAAAAAAAILLDDDVEEVVAVGKGLTEVPNAPSV